MQHLISKLNANGMGVVVHNGSTLFSGDAGSAESNIRKWMLDSDILEAVIQLPTDEFFNTGIYTYLWVLNKNKPGDRQERVMLINASEKFKPFDSYTMNEAIKDGFILNPLKNIVPVASKMLFDLPSNELEGFEAPNYKDADKKQIYENRDRIYAIAQYIADLLVKDVYRQIRGTGKAMLAVYSIKAAIAYKQAVTQQFNELVKQPKYAKYADAPIYIIYSSNQDEQSATGLNDGLSEEKVLENFALKKNGLIIVVAKLQTGFDEKKLHTLFLDKEIKGIADDGKRLVVKINSNVSEDEIYDDFAKIYRKYKVLNRREIGDYFFKETEDLVNKLCDDFETIVRNAQNHY
jgi:hypothetical protein